MSGGLDVLGGCAPNGGMGIVVTVVTGVTGVTGVAGDLVTGGVPGGISANSGIENCRYHDMYGFVFFCTFVPVVGRKQVQRMHTESEKKQQNDK